MAWNSEQGMWICLASQCLNARSCGSAMDHSRFALQLLSTMDCISLLLDIPQDTQEAVAMSARDAMMMPLQLGMVLAALYVGVQYISPEWTGLLVSIYFSTVASLSIGSLIGAYLQQALYGVSP